MPRSRQPPRCVLCQICALQWLKHFHLVCVLVFFVLVPHLPFAPLSTLLQDDSVRKGYQAWLQSARVADAVAEIEVLKTEASSLLDKHLAKTAEQVCVAYRSASPPCCIFHRIQIPREFSDIPLRNHRRGRSRTRAWRRW